MISLKPLLFSSLLSHGVFKSVVTSSSSVLKGQKIETGGLVASFLPTVRHKKCIHISDFRDVKAI